MTKPKFTKDKVYFPWNRERVQIPSQRTFFKQRSIRNRNLITEKEQEIFRNFSIGIAGLSVGNSVALALTLEGGANHMKLADFDKLELSNLNRIRAGVHHIGLNKAVLTAQQIYELNPYAELELFLKGLSEKILPKFLKNLNLVVDEMDNVEMKIKLRLMARKFRIPIVSTADNGDNTIVDVERFDLEPKRPIFHGRIEKINLDNKLEVIKKMVGFEYVTPRMKASLKQIGKELETWPQLGGASMLCGAALVHVIRKISLGESMKSGKYNVSLDNIWKRQ